jgi:hypothetical protein
LGRHDHVAGMPLLEHVLAGNDPALALRVRGAVEPALMAKNSLAAGFLADAVRYLKIAHESNPMDDDVVLKLGWAYNMLHDDKTAEHWFELARHSNNTAIASEANTAFENLRPSLQIFRTTAWVLPFYSSRWNDGFGYGQIKVELNQPKFRVTPYVSTRFISDTQPAGSGPPLSEKSIIVGLGLQSQWKGVTAWAEAGSAIGYTRGSMLPDYRGGLSWAKGSRTKAHLFWEAGADEVFISRFHDDWLTYFQSRAGWRCLMFAANVTADSAGPGVRIHLPATPKNLLFSLTWMKGVYLVNDGIYKEHGFNDLRAGFWYAITK